MSDSPELTTGMATGSEAGAPGDHLPELPLEDDERAMLDALERPASGEPIAAVEDSPQMVEAAEDDSPLPPELVDAETPGDADDPDTPRFQAPPA
jgi:hypothetical protein